MSRLVPHSLQRLNKQVVVCSTLLCVHSNYVVTVYTEISILLQDQQLLVLVALIHRVDIHDRPLCMPFLIRQSRHEVIRCPVESLHKDVECSLLDRHLNRDVITLMKVVELIVCYLVRALIVSYAKSLSDLKDRLSSRCYTKLEGCVFPSINSEYPIVSHTIHFLFLQECSSCHVQY